METSNARGVHVQDFHLQEPQVPFRNAADFTEALFRLPQNSKFFYSLFITSIFSRMYGVLNIGKKITNYID